MTGIYKDQQAQIDAFVKMEAVRQSVEVQNWIRKLSCLPQDLLSVDVLEIFLFFYLRTIRNAPQSYKDAVNAYYLEFLEANKEVIKRNQAVQNFDRYEREHD